jgi:glutaredoxin
MHKIQAGQPVPFGLFKYLVLTLMAMLLCQESSFQIARGATTNATVVGAETTQQNPSTKVRCIALECYAKLSDESTKAEVEFIREWVAKRAGITLKVHDLDAGDKERERLQQIESAYKLSNSKLPVVYGMNQVVMGLLTREKWTAELTRLVTMQVYVRQGCSKCASAKQYLPGLRARYPGMELQYMDVVNDPAANQSYHELTRSQRIGGISFPGFWFCRQLVVGFESASSTGSRLEAILKKWTFDCELPKVGSYRARATETTETWLNANAWGIALSPLASLTGFISNKSQDDQPPLGIGDQSTELPLPSDSPELSIDQQNSAEASSTDADEIDVPLFGRISASRIGMPAFTLLIGLVDGFNPCAMWVLLFLLSVLVNLRVRWKILAVAGTFVVVSGLAYFAFMAAWLNVLLFVGYLRWVQIGLAILAIFVGSVHVKDFFAFKRGLSLSIPESAKPGIYARVRSIVMAEHLYGAITGAFVLAVLVNFIELLCTAGLPALYSQVLMLQDFPAWKNYAYLALYILAYMLDDAIMVGIVVATLGKRKLQENEGRWLKLVSGLVILALGIVLLLKPDWLL